MMASNNRPISTFPLPPSIQSKLTKAGLLTANSILGFRPSELSSNAEITLEEAADVLDLLGESSTSISTKTAFELLLEEMSRFPIYSMSERLDKILDGGVKLAKLTEISGVAGVGKTQLCLQLCVSVQIPAEFGGNGGQAIYIDTEGSFNTTRLQDMGNACLRHCRLTMNIPSEAWSMSSIVDNIFVFRCREITELLSCVSVLGEFIRTHSKVKLIVIDSLAFHFRHDLENAALRSRALHRIAAQLSTLAVQHQLAVVATNQMTTKFDSAGQSHLTPALGTSWGHAPTFRLLLDWDPSHSFRWATLIKSSCLPAGSAPYQVSKDGIRDIDITGLTVVPPRIIVEEGIPGVSFD